MALTPINAVGGTATAGGEGSVLTAHFHSE